MSTILYFGCIKESGHYLWNEGLVHEYRAEALGISRSLERSLDGLFCPPEGSHYYEYMCSHVPPWRIISWWDCSVDTRPGSHSTFLFKDYSLLVDPEKLLEDAARVFPSVFTRQSKIKPYKKMQSIVDDWVVAKNLADALTGMVPISDGHLKMKDEALIAYHTKLGDI